MKFSISRENFLKPLQLVQSVVERRQTAVILGNVLLDLQGDFLRLMATDREVEMTVSVFGVTGEGDGRITVPARKLLDICRASPEGVTVRFHFDGERVTVNSGRAKFTLTTLPASDFPAIDPVVAKCIFTTSQGNLKALITGTYFAMAQQDIRYYLNGTLLEIGKSYVRLVATDGHRLSLGEIKSEQDLVDVLRIIVPRKTIIEALRLLDSSDDDIQLEVGADQISIRSSSIVLRSKLIEGSFPDYERVIPKSYSGKVLVSKESLCGALSRAVILSNEKLRAVRVELTQTQLRISARNNDSEESEEFVETRYVGNDVEIGFNSSYLLDVLNAIPAQEIQIQLKDASNSVLIMDANTDLFKYVVMPMKL